MGKDKREWRKLVKKLRRQRKRQESHANNSISSQNEKNIISNIEEKEDESFENESGDEEEEEEKIDSRFFLTEEEWGYREEQTQLELSLKKAEKQRLEEIEAREKKKIRDEWEATLEQERKLKEESERLAKIKKEKQEAEFNEFLSFLSGDIETPPTTYLMPEDNDVGKDDMEVCFYYAKTATCRFQDKCTKMHPRPTLSTAILIPNFFSHFKLEKAVRDEYDSDIGLEYEDRELYAEFLEFYEDVVPELRKHGTLIQFKVCCNLEPHLRGNVYVQYQNIREAVEAFRKFNGRFYNGKQLSLQFIKMDSWRSAICGAFLRKACVKGRTCSFLHVFRNPTKEFVNADHDWKGNSSRHQHRNATNSDIQPEGSTVTSTSETVQVKRSDRESKYQHSGNGEIRSFSSSHSVAGSNGPDRSSSKGHQHSKRKADRSHSPTKKAKKRKKEKKNKKSKKHKNKKRHKKSSKLDE